MIADPWVDIDMAASRLAQIFDGEVPSEARRRVWQQRIWVWVHRARASGAEVPAWERRGRRVYYRLTELEEFASQRVRPT